MHASVATVVVTGANGFAGSRICAVLAERGADVRALVRRAGTAPEHPRISEVVGDFGDADFSATVVAGASAVVTTVHPMGSDRATQRRVSVVGTPVIARAAAAAGVARLIHLSTAAVYDRSPTAGDISETSALVADDSHDYYVTKRDTDLALAGVDGITRILLRPPAIFGPGPTSTWNTVRPAQMREDPEARRAVADASRPWVHLSDLATLAADLADGHIPDAEDPGRGPLPGGCTALNVAVRGATQGEYYEAVTAALGVDPVWEDAPGWTGQILSDRARAWGWTPTVSFSQALAEIVAGLSG